MMWVIVTPQCLLQGCSYLTQVKGESRKDYIHDQNRNKRENVRAFEEGDDIEGSLWHLHNTIFEGKWHMTITIREQVDVGYAMRHDNQLILQQGKDSLLWNC